MKEIKNSFPSFDFCSILTIQSGSNSDMINGITKKVEEIRPMVAITKLDECWVGAEEFSSLALNNSRIGLVTGTKVIIDSIIEANENALTKYMKDNFEMSDSIAITSGKGGVGKTTIAVNLSIALKKISSEVFLLDTDLGMANSHVLLGVNPEHSISDVINNEKNLSEIVVQSKSGVQLISGGTASSNLLNVENKKRYAILNQIDNHLKDLNDVKLVVDIAAGAEDNALVFAMACDRIVIVIVGEPTSFVDSYALLKAIFSKSAFKNYCIVVNQVQDEDQGKDLFLKFQKIATKFLDVNLHYAGCIKNSTKIRKSIINRVPLVSEEPKSEISQSFLKVAKKIYETPINEWGGLTFLSKSKKKSLMSRWQIITQKSQKFL